MKYALLIYDEETDWENASEEELRRVYAEHEAYSKAMAEAGVVRGGAELAPSRTATSMRFENGRKSSLSDGPFAETREHLGGFYLIEVDDLDQALHWAERMPAMKNGCVEVRPLGMSADD